MLDRHTFVALARATLEAVRSDDGGDARARAVRMTSGTTGSPLVLMMDHAPDPSRAALWYGGAKRIMVCIGSRNARLFNAYPHFRFGDDDVSVLALDAVDLQQPRAKLLSAFAPERLVGFPSIIVRVGGLLTPEARENVRSIRMTGEVLSKEMEDYLRDAFPQAKQSMVYAMNEVGILSKTNCTHLPRNEYHPSHNVKIDIVDVEEGIGEIVVSKSNIFRDFSVEHYRTGDYGRFISNECPCGDLVTFELLGRKGYDYIKVAGVILTLEECERVMRHMPYTIEDYRIEVSAFIKDGIPRGNLILEVSMDGRAGTDALGNEIAHAFSEKLFLTPSRTLASFVKDDVFRITVRFRTEPYPHGNKRVKLIQKV